MSLKSCFSCIVRRLIAAAFLLITSASAQQPVEFTSSNLPIVVIDTGGRPIIDARKIEARMRIIDHGPGRRNRIDDSDDAYNGRIGIEYRGSSTMSFPKKQFAVETRDESGANLNVPLLGMPPENDWVLYGPYSDKSLMRNVLAYKLWAELGHYSPRTRFCELVLNGRYWGVYVMIEKIKRDKNRVNIAKLDSTDLLPPAVTGGYIIKIDKPAGENLAGWQSTMPLFFKGATSPKPYYQFHYPKPDEIMPQQAEYIRTFITDLERMMAGPDYDDPAGGMWTALDMGSVIDYCLINELSKNVDGYRLSAFMYKDRDDRDPRLHMGPVWDYNLAFGNADYHSASTIEGWQIEFFLNDERFNMGGDAYMIPFWWGKIWYSPRFQNKLYQRWWQVRPTVLDVDRLLTFIDRTAVELDEARQRNFKCWPVLGTYVWPNAFIGSSYAEEIEYLKRWLQDRMEWMDDHLAFDPASAPAAVEPETFSLGEAYPNPFNGRITVPLRNAQPYRITVRVYDVAGRMTAVLHDGLLPAGESRLVWDGCRSDGMPAASGVYIIRVEGDLAAHKKILLVR